jgi:hypothetical protein
MGGDISVFSCIEDGAGKIVGNNIVAQQSIKETKRVWNVGGEDYLLVVKRSFAKPPGSDTIALILICTVILHGIRSN